MINQKVHYATRALCNTCIIKHVHYATNALCKTCMKHYATPVSWNTCILQHMHFATCALWNMFTMQLAHYATQALCNTCNMQQVHYATSSLCSTCIMQHGYYKTHTLCNTRISTNEGPYLVSRVVPHLRVRGGECPVIPQVHWKGVALPRQRSSRTLKTLSNCKGFYSVFSAVERFCIWEISFIILIDFSIYVWEIS